MLGFKESAWSAVSFIILIMTAILFWSIFAPNQCDREAALSAQEIKRAIECASEYDDGINPDTGEPCNVASARLCQAEDSGIFGLGWGQAYYGLMNPDYLIYFKEFPKKSVTTAFGQAPFYVHWSESYPIERARAGQRIWDNWDLGFYQYNRPTMTAFKEYFKTRYLEEGCTDDTALCFNNRGKEEIVEINADIDDVKVTRRVGDIKLQMITGLEEYDFSLKTDDDPRFHLIAPCYARLTFTKDGNDILVDIDKCGTSGSNYCYADEGVLGGVAIAYATEIGCYKLDLLATIFTGGGKAVAKESAEAGAKAGAKIAGKQLSKQALKEIGEAAVKKAGVKTSLRKGAKEISEEFIEFGITEGGKKAGYKFQTKVVKQFVKEIAQDEIQKKSMKKIFAKGVFSKLVTKEIPKKMGIPTTKASWLRALGIPCVDVDYCRGAGACLEATALWPGLPFKELTTENMGSTCRSTETASEIFAECCKAHVYGKVDDVSSIICEEPSYLMELVKPTINATKYEEYGDDYNVSLLELGEYLGFENAGDVKSACNMIKGVYNKNCVDSIEVDGSGINDGHGDLTCDGSYMDIYFSTYTFDFEEVQSTSSISANLGMRADECDSKISVLISRDAEEWEEVYRGEANAFPDNNKILVKDPDGMTLRYVRFTEIVAPTEDFCYFDYGDVVLGAFAVALDAEPNTEYKIGAHRFNYFITPDDYSNTASELCSEVVNCTTVSAGEVFTSEGSSTEIKYYADIDQEDFEISGLERIGIMTNSSSTVVFNVG